MKLRPHYTTLALITASILTCSFAGCKETNNDAKSEKAKPEAEAKPEKEKPDKKKEKPKAKPANRPKPKPSADAGKKKPFDPTDIVLNSEQRQKAQWALVNRLFAEQDPTTLSATQADLALSPASLTNALQALWWGTRGDTALELAKLFGAQPNKKSDKKKKEKPAKTTKKSGSLGGKLSLNMDSGLWFNSSFPVRDEYRDLLKKRGFGTAEAIDWSKTKEAVGIVNKWCSNATEGKIPTLFEVGDIKPPVAFVLASVISFNGSWASSFDPKKTQAGDFSLLDGKKTPVSYLTATREAQFAIVDGGTRLLGLPFAGGHHRLVAVLPEKSGAKALRRLERQMADKMPDWITKLAETKVAITLPKFDVSGTVDPVAALKALGVKSIFSNKKADFSGASEQGGLSLDAIRHHAVVSIDEKGAEAAGATGVSVTEKSIDINQEFRADRAFLYFILGDDGDVLFAGRVASPKAAGTVTAGIEQPAN